jgi:rod shape-determining protein MreC
MAPGVEIEAMRIIHRYRDPVISVVLLTLPFFFLNANLKHPDELSPLDRVILQISAPIQWVAAAMARGASDIWDRYIYLVATREENTRLRRENTRLRDENRRYQAVAEEARRLSKMLEFREMYSGDLISARVVARDTNRFFRVVRLRIDRAETEIRPGMPVLTYDGLVGQVSRTWGRFSDVRLIIDPSSSVDVVVQRTSSRGILRGTGDPSQYVCTIEYLRRTDEVREGDLVFTSGAGRRFTEGILVGRLSRITRRSYGLYQQVEVTPAVDISRLQEVFVQVSEPRSDLDAEGTPEGPELGQSGD